MIDFCIGGAPKCATTALFDYLAQHPDIFACEPKEPHYFASASLGRTVMQGNYTRAEYAALFDSALARQKKGEGSTHYLHHAKYVAPLMAKEAQRARLIFCLRHPVARTWSHYLYRYTNAGPFVAGGVGSHDSFLEFAARDEIFAMGNYVSNLAIFADYFSEEQMHIVFMEDVASDLRGALRGICSHIGVDPAFDFDLSERSNETLYPKWPAIMGPLDNAIGKLYPHLPLSFRKRLLQARQSLLFDGKASKPKIDRRDRAILLERYVPGIEKLEQMTGRNLDSWKR